MNFLAELRRRNVIRVAGLYVVTAWLLIQIAETLLPIFDTPGWVLQAMVVLLALGFIPALVFSWVFELTPEGIKRESEIDRSQSVVDHTARKLDMAVIVLLLAVGAITGWSLLGRPDSPRATVDAPRGSESVSSADSSTKPAEGQDKDSDSMATDAVSQSLNTKSIAVLPFSDLSPERDQEYFSDGISEEILNALAKVRDLKVAGRTSSFAFKGRNEDLREIGKTLGVAHILEGSVRKQGERVRITAQLIQVDDGFHLWSETYDGELNDIFELQESIARAITDELQVILQGEQQQRLVPAATGNAEAYGMYLQASAIFNRREGERFAEAIDLLEAAIRLDPRFARAHARMGALLALAPQYSGADFDRSVAAALLHADAAIGIDPGLAEAYAVRAQVHSSRREFLAEQESFRRALEAEPDDVLSLFWQGSSLVNCGYLKRGEALLERVLEVDPLLPNALMWRGSRYVFEGNLIEGERLLQQADASGISNVGVGLAHLAQRQGHTDEAVRQLARGLETFMSAFPPGSARIVAEGSFGSAAQREAALRVVDDYLETEPDVVAGAAPYALLRLGQPARALALMAKAPTDADAVFNFLLWSDVGAEARQLPEFSQFAEDTGLAKLWDTLGAPDLCHKQASGDYVCE